MTQSKALGVDLATRLVSLPLVAMKATGMLLPDRVDLPACSISVPNARLLVAATPEPAPMFADTLEPVSRSRDCDILLIRSGRHPETIDAVMVEVALRFGGDALVIQDLLFFRHHDRGLWLVPAARGPFLELTPTGLRLEMLAPFIDADDRSAGLCRAAAEIARLARRRSGPG